MKFTNEHYKKLTNHLKGFLARYSIEELVSHMDMMKENPKIKNHLKAYRWDILFASGFRVGDGVGVDGDVNGDYTDSHIDTALRKFFDHKEQICQE